MAKHPRTPCLLLASLLALLAVEGTQAAILAEENFGDNTGMPMSLPVLDASTGFGWASGWSNQTGTGQRSNITSLNLTASYRASLGDTGFLGLNERCGRNLDVSTGGPFAAYIDSAGNIGKDNSVLYVACVFGSSGPIDNYYGLEFHRDGINDAARIVQVASEIATAPAPVRGLDLRAYNTASGAENFMEQTASKGDYFVLKFEFGAGNADKVSLYVNPPFHALESSVTPIAQIQGTDLSFDRISFGNFGPTSPRFCDFDDIRVAQNWADITGDILTKPFDIWAYAKGLTGGTRFESGFGDDPDKDGILNGMEWILGMNPLSGSRTAGLVISHESTGNCVVSFPAQIDSFTETTLNLQYDTALSGSWSSVPITGSNSGPDANGITVDVDTSTDPAQVEVRFPSALAPDGKLFFRLISDYPN